MTVLRVYDPAECDEHGVPLDWERCRTCGGSGEAVEVLTPGRDPRDPACETRESPCPTCAEHGSLKAAALVARRAYVLRSGKLGDIAARLAEFCTDRDSPEYREGYEAGRQAARKMTARCEGCGHPMSEGTWEGDIAPVQTGYPTGAMTIADNLDWARQKLATGREPVYPDGIVSAVHYSRCDEGCEHFGGGLRMPAEGGGWEAEADVGKDWPREWAGGDPAAYGVEASWRPVDIRTLGWPHDVRPEKLAVLCLRCYAARVTMP